MCECFPLCVLVCYLLSAEQKKATQGLGVLMSVEGDRYMASEKQVKSSFSSSVLNTREGCGSREKEAGCEKHVKCKKLLIQKQTECSTDQREKRPLQCVTKDLTTCQCQGGRVFSRQRTIYDLQTSISLAMLSM